MATVTKIIESIESNPEGGTLGLYEPVPAAGYLVGGGSVSALILDGPDREEIETFLSYLAETVVWVRYVGWWTDSETGRLYVDGVEHFEDRDQAEARAVSYGEIAYFDVAAQKEIRL